MQQLSKEQWIAVVIAIIVVMTSFALIGPLLFFGFGGFGSGAGDVPPPPPVEDVIQ